MIVVELFEELLDCRDVRLGQGMTFLGQVFTEELDVVLVHLVESSCPPFVGSRHQRATCKA